MKNLLKNKRGMAIESAIMFMFIVFMFGLLLSGIVMTTHLRVKVNNTLLTRELEIEQIGENFVYMDKTSFSTYISKNSKYSIDEQTIYTDKNNKTLTLKRNTSTVLKITVEGGKITSWKYSD